jgi:hypothetical protein
MAFSFISCVLWVRGGEGWGRGGEGERDT